MANPAADYNQGVTSVQPTEDTPRPYQNASAATPAAFGGQIAEGGEALGKGMLTSSQFFGKVAADNASNDFQDFATKLLHGDPSKTIPGPDGQPMPDTGYLGTRGRATLDQRPDVEKAMDDRLKAIRETLTSPDQQLEFDNFSRRYRSMVQERIGSHADGQATTWYQSVNTNSAKLAMDHIANNFDNPNEVAAGASDLTAAYVKNAQLQGATGPYDPQIKEAFASARRDALDAQLNAMAVKDPSRALAILDKNKDVAGTKYDDLANKFRVRADQQRGQDIGEQAIRRTYQGAAPSGFQPVDLTAAGAPYGISGSYLQRVHQLEGNSTSSTGAQGPFQFIPSTAKQYGLKNPFDMQASADAAARLAADNRNALTDRLGRPPTDAELYLAHQQGSDGAAKLLAHPNTRAGDIVGDKAIRVNGGDPNAPASTFTTMWAAKFAGAPGQANAMRKASAYQDILSIPDIDPNVRQHALAYVNQQMTAQQVAEEQDAKAKKTVSDQAMDKYVSRMLTGQTGNMVNEIANDPNLTPEVKWHLGEAVQKASGDDVQTATQTYGPGFWAAYKQVTAPMDDPSRIGDPTTLLRLAGGEVDPEHRLTLAGVQKLQTMQRENAKSVDAASVNTTKTGLLNYAKSKLSFEQDTGPVKIRDPEGEMIFNARFIPKFETAYDKWIKDGKNPYDFLTQENVDKLMTGMRDKSKMENARLNATGEAVGDQPIPQAPTGVDEKAWQGVIASPPRGKNGPWPAAAWAGAINRLRSDPSPETRAAFDQWFAPSGYTADAILKRLPVPERDISTEGMPAPETGVAEPPKPGLLERIRKSNQDALKELDKQPNVLHKAATGAASVLQRIVPGESTEPAVGMGIRG